MIDWLITKGLIMDATIYDTRGKFDSLPLDFQHLNGINYKSNLEYCKTLSTYHFDKWVKEEEGTWYSKVGNFEIREDVAKYLPFFEKESLNVGWNELSTKGVHPGFPGGQSPLHEQEEYDRISSGVTGDFTQVVPEPELLDIPFLRQMTDYWQMKRARIRVHVQMPGQMFPWHVDKLQHRNPANPSKMLRMIVNLQDYEPGQLMVYGNSVLTQWKAGDIHCFDTNNIPHATANMSRTPRSIFVITGVRTAETDAILSTSDANTIHKFK